MAFPWDTGILTRTNIWGNTGTPASVLTQDPVGSMTGGLVVRTIEQLNGLGLNSERIVSERTPIASLTFHYGVSNTEKIATTLVNGGTVTGANSMAVISSGTNAAGSAQLESNNAARYVSGTGLVASFSALYSPGVANAQQEAGIGTMTDFFGFGYVGTAFGIIWRNNSVQTFIPQSTWNYDKFDGTGPTTMVLNPAMGNVYKIQFLWHGFGAVIFWIYDGVHYQRCHTFRYANQNTIPHTANPDLPLHVRVWNTGATTSQTISTGSMAIYCEGYDPTGAWPSISVAGGTHNTKTVGTTPETEILTIQNMPTNVYGGTNLNKVRVKLSQLSIQYGATAGTQTALFRIVKNTTLGGTPLYTPFDVNTSVVAVDTAGTTLTGGRERFSYQLYGGTSQVADLSELGLWLNPGDTYTISVITTRSDVCFASVSWDEYP